MNLPAAAKTMAESPGAMHLRTLQTIDGLGPSASNTVVLAVPVEIMEIISSLKDLLRTRTRSAGFPALSPPHRQSILLL